MIIIGPTPILFYLVGHHPLWVRAKPESFLRLLDSFSERAIEKEN